MMSALLKFFAMGGYGFYVWLAYGSVFVYLFLQLYIPLRRWLRFKRDYQAKQTS